MAKGKGGCLKGCAIGCLLILVVVLAAAGFLWFRYLAPMKAAMENAEALMSENREIRGQIAELDATYGYTSPEDLSTVVVSQPDLDRYVAVRTAVQDEAAHLAATEDSVLARFEMREGAEPHPMDLIKGIFGAVKDIEPWAEANNALLKAAAQNLQEQEMGPAELRDLMAIVEWRFLGREEAVFLGLPPELGQDLVGKRKALAMAEWALATQTTYGGDEGQISEMESRVADLREEIAQLEAQARENRGLAPATQQLLVKERGRLETLDAAGLSYIGTITEEREPFFIEGLEQMR